MIALLLATRALAWPTDDAAWVPLTQSGVDIVDVYNDHDRAGVGAPDGIDCVGDTTNAWPALYWWTDGTELFLRVRVDETPWLVDETALLPDDWSFLFETDGNVDDWEYVVAATGVSPTLYAYSNDTGDGDGSGDDGVAATPDSLINFWDDTYVRAAITGSEGGSTSNIHTIDDWFVDVRIELAELPAIEFFGDTFRVAFVSGNTSTPIGADADLCGTDDTTALGALSAAWSDSIGVDQDSDGLTDIEEDAIGSDKTDADSDDDGVSDIDEVRTAGSSPILCDTDGDGLTDGQELGVSAPLDDTDTSAGCFEVDGDSGDTTTLPTEVDSDGGTVSEGLEDRDQDGVWDTWETNPNDGSDDLDNDGDGIPDALEDLCGGADTTDRDGDGIPDEDEGFADTDGDGTPDFCEEDDDDDGVTTAEELGEDGTTETDSDGDGKPDYQDSDSDDNGIDDGDEPDGDADCDGILDRNDLDETDGECADPDADGVTNADEDICGSNPENPDTDGDGIGDAEESCEDDVDCDGLPDRLDADTDPDGCNDPVDTAGTPTDLCTGPLCGGHYTGGSCSTGGGAASVFGALLAGALVTRRRRRGQNLIVSAAVAGGALALLPGVAHAEDATVNAQRFHPAFENDTFLSIHDSHARPPGLGGGLVFNYAAAPLEYRYDDERMPLQLLSSAASLDLGVSWAAPHFALTLDMPLHLVDGAQIDSQFAPGDLRVSALGEIADRTRGGLGLGIYGDVALPTGNGEAWVGSGSPELGAGVAFSWGKAVVLAGNVGLQVASPAELDSLSWGSRVQWGAGVDVPVGSALALVAELDGESAIATTDTVGSSPIEWRAGAKAHLTRNLVASAGFGTGVTLGIGAPEYRVVAGLGWSPAHREARVAHGPDRDGDGIGDAQDLCPDQPEDKNGVADEDGCPDAGLVPTHLVVTDNEGKKLAGASIELTSGPETGRWAVPDGDFTRSFAPGEYQVRARAPHYVPQNSSFVIPDAPRHEKVIQLDAAPIGGMVIVSVQNEVGQPIAALVTILGEGRKFTTGADGTGAEPVPTGQLELSVWAENYRPKRVSAEVAKDQKTSVTVILEPSRVVVLADRVDIRDKVFFDLDSAVITAVSYPILDDVAATLDNHAELRLVEVQGHTDDQGAEDYNQDLSQRRAEAVRKYLIAQGVEPDRLVARGYGETQPLQPGTTADARDVNRRVMFKILAGPSGDERPMDPRPPKKGPKRRE